MLIFSFYSPCLPSPPPQISRLVTLADAAFADATSPPVQVEEVVAWMGPCLSGETPLQFNIVFTFL